MKSVVLIKDLSLDKNQGHLGYVATVGSVILADVSDGCGYNISVSYAKSFAIVQAQMGPKLVSVIRNSRVSTVEGF